MSSLAMDLVVYAKSSSCSCFVPFLHRIADITAVVHTRVYFSFIVALAASGWIEIDEITKEKYNTIII